MSLKGWAWDHAKAVADRCAMRFKNPKDIKRYLAYCGWEPHHIDQIMKYIDRKKEATE